MAAKGDHFNIKQLIKLKKRTSKLYFKECAC